MNNPSAQISFTFQYDGATRTVSVDTRKDPVNYQSIADGHFHPLFANIATGVVGVALSIPNTGNLAGSSVPTTATINSSGLLDVNIPSGLPIGQLTVTATLTYNN